jgi:hypothetical protein
VKPRGKARSGTSSAAAATLEIGFIRRAS